jgi:hypothetical protein
MKLLFNCFIRFKYILKKLETQMVQIFILKWLSNRFSDLLAYLKLVHQINKTPHALFDRI